MNNVLAKIFYILALYFCPLIGESSLEIRSSAFFHSAKRFREIYGNVSGSYQLEASTSLCNCLEGWTNFDWYTKHGKSKGLEDPTRVSIANISIGIKFPSMCCECFMPYVGLGASLSGIWLKNKSHCTHETVSKLAVGGVIKTGICYFFTGHTFIDVFVDYLYQPVHFKKHVDIGGLKTGIGLGVRF